MNKLQKKIREIEEEHAEEVLNEHLSEFSEKERDNALILLGGFKVANRISQSLNAELIRALMLFQEQKLYRSLGYDDFAEFLNNSEYAPMTKNQFYDRKKVIENEGDVVFDLLNGIGMPIQKRKLLGKGNVHLEGENVIVLDNETGEEMSIELKDRARLLETLSALADANADKSRKIVNEKKKTERLEKNISDLRESIEIERKHARLDALDPHSTALMNLINACQMLKAEAENLTLVEKEQFAPRTFETIARQLDALSVAYNRSPSAETDESRIASKINDDELADLMD